MSEIIRDLFGCDFAVKLPESRNGGEIRLLQLTDMQLIDAEQRRTPDRLRPDEIAVWQPEFFDAKFGDHARSVIAGTNPDMIFITGDFVYGSFDDSGKTFEWLCDFFDSFKIPWAPVFGNHDNECAKGVAWQCERFAASKYCMFSRGNVSGNCNYTVGICVGDSLKRVLYMTDSNGCGAATDESVIKIPAIFPDQLEKIRSDSERIAEINGRTVPGFMAFHIPVAEFSRIARLKGYEKDNSDFYTIGVTVPAKDGDFGAKYEKYSEIDVGTDFVEFLHECGIDGVFAGHNHNICTCVSHDGIRFVTGLKTGQYDYHVVGMTGGTAVTLCDDTFNVSHVPSLVPLSPYPKEAGFVKKILSE